MKKLVSTQKHRLSGTNLDRNLQNELTKLYYDPRSPGMIYFCYSNASTVYGYLVIGSFGGVRRLYLAARDMGIKVTHQMCTKFLETQAPYQLFRRRRIKYQRNRYVTPGLYVWTFQMRC